MRNVGTCSCELSFAVRRIHFIWHVL